MATNEEIMAVVKKTQILSGQPNGMTPDQYNTLTDEEKVLLNEWMLKQVAKLGTSGGRNRYGK